MHTEVELVQDHDRLFISGGLAVDTVGKKQEGAVSAMYRDPKQPHCTPCTPYSLGWGPDSWLQVRWQQMVRLETGLWPLYCKEKTLV